MAFIFLLVEAFRVKTVEVVNGTLSCLYSQDMTPWHLSSVLVAPNAAADETQEESRKGEIVTDASAIAPQDNDGIPAQHAPEREIVAERSVENDAWSAARPVDHDDDARLILEAKPAVSEELSSVSVDAVPIPPPAPKPAPAPAPKPIAFAVQTGGGFASAAPRRPAPAQLSLQMPSPASAPAPPPPPPAFQASTSPEIDAVPPSESSLEPISQSRARRAIDILDSKATPPSAMAQSQAQMQPQVPLITPAAPIRKSKIETPKEESIDLKSKKKVLHSSPRAQKRSKGSLLCLIIIIAV